MATTRGKTRRRGSKKRSEQQLTFPRWGQRRPGGGRKRSRSSGVSHLQREVLAARYPVHVTMKIRRGLPRMRARASYRVICEAFARGCERAGRLEGGVFRLVHYSVQNDHLHLICEARDRLSLSRGLQGLSTSLAMRLNRLWKRRGKVFADRYHDHILRTPREVRNALRYVLNNGRKHLQHFHRHRPDIFSSGAWFDGWRGYICDGFMGSQGPITLARTWLLGTGWRRHGRIPLAEHPKPR